MVKQEIIKIILIVTFSLVLLLTLPSSVQAEPQTNIEINAQAVESAIVNHKDSVSILFENRITITESNIITKKFSKEYDAGWLLAYGIKWEPSKNIIIGPMVDKYDFYYELSKSQAKKTRKAAKKIAEAAKKKYPNSKRKQLGYVNNVLCNRLTYPPRTDKDIYYTSYAGLCTKQAVCQGYTRAFSLVASYLDIKTYIAANRTHEGNIVLLGGKEYMVDVTGNDSRSERATSAAEKIAAREKYFLKKPNKFHTPTEWKLPVKTHSIN